VNTKSTPSTPQIRVQDHPQVTLGSTVHELMQHVLRSADNGTYITPVRLVMGGGVQTTVCLQIRVTKVVLSEFRDGITIADTTEF
jgi:hypothetical protein